MSSLTSALARAMIDAATQAAETAGVRATIAVVDGGGHLVALSRMDGAPLASLESAQVKARTAVFFQTATTNLPADLPITPALIGAVSYPVAFLAGGLPLRDQGGAVVGAVGVGGGTVAQDEEAAEVGAAAFHDY